MLATSPTLTLQPWIIQQYFSSVRLGGNTFVTSSGTHVADGGIDVYFYSISGAIAGDAFHLLEGQQPNAPAGVVFTQSVLTPEPSSFFLFTASATALLMRRRR
jgi:hypothetical protein